MREKGVHLSTQVPCWSILVLVVLLHMTPGCNGLALGLIALGPGNIVGIDEQGLVRHLEWGQNLHQSILVVVLLAPQTT